MDTKGKRLEYIIKIIQETLKDSPNTTVYQNYKIENIVGTKREFDVLVQSTVSGFNIKIAIECKDYNRPVSVEKIEAFETKCSMVPEIHKKVFISSNGFQKEAMNVAKAKGIELQVASAIDSNLIMGWFTINEISILLLSGGDAQLFLDEDEETLKSVTYTMESSFLNKGNQIKLNEYLIEYYLSNKYTINDFASIEWIKIQNDNKEKPFFVPLKIHPENLFFIDSNGKKIRVTSIIMKYLFQFKETSAELKDSFDLKQLDGDLKARTLSAQLDENTEVNFVKTPNNKTTLHINGPNKDRSHLRIITFSPTVTKIIRFD